MPSPNKKKPARLEKSVVIDANRQRCKTMNMEDMRSESMGAVREKIDTSTDPNYRKKIHGILKDGETKKFKLLVNNYGARTKKNADTLPKKQAVGYDRILKRNHWNGAYQQGVNVDSFGTNRLKYLTELRKTQSVWSKDPVLVDAIEKMKNSNEFRKEYPIMTNNPADPTKYGVENYNSHNPGSKRGYARHELGYGYKLM